MGRKVFEVEVCTEEPSENGLLKLKGMKDFPY
jgi:hypothetical protein